MKKGQQEPSRSPKRENPIAHVVFEARDLSGIENSGGKSTEFVPITNDLRNHLSTNLSEIYEFVGMETTEFPNLPSVIVISLREEAIAKSHRPLEMIHEAGMLPAGHGALNEMLVTATLANLEQLNRVLKNRDTKKIRANLSAVEKFEAWDIKRRLPDYLKNLEAEDIFSSLALLSKRLFIRLFSHRGFGITDQIVSTFHTILDFHSLKYLVINQRSGSPIFLIEINENLTLEVFMRILKFQGLKTLKPEPYLLPSQAQVIEITGTANSLDLPPDMAPTVAVFDTGIDPEVAALQPWINGRDVYVLPPDTNYIHGTQVSSLLINAHGFNANHIQIPNLPCKVYDVCALESAGSGIGDLIVRLRAALSKNSSIKVWNLSLGGGEITDDEFSEFARELDDLSDAFGVLFIVAAGNYLGTPRRIWPINGQQYSDRISSPGDSIRALTVGSVAHLEDENSLAKIGEPAPYSRRGPGPVFTPKPDLVHIGGNADNNLNPGIVGINTMIPGGSVICANGTSFAAPIAASLAAYTWQSLDLPGRAIPLKVTPTLVKALMVHSAALSSPTRDSIERRYYGSGLPENPLSVLYDSDSSFTALFEVEMVDNVKWRKSSFPIPASLMVDGRLTCEVIMTAAYAPPVNSSAGTEYVRVNVDVGFGFLATNSEGSIVFKGQVPSEGEIGTTGFEKAQVEHGGKWSPIKVYRRAMPKGVKAGNWALQATMLRRANEPPLAQPLKVIIVITLRSLNENSKVYQEGQRALAATNWVNQTLPIGVEIRT